MNFPPRVEEIIKQVCTNHWVTRESILGRSRMEMHMNARAELFRRVREDLGFSFPQIGVMFGLHHASVMYYFKRKRKPVSRPKPNPEDRTIPVPDLSGEWAI